VRALDRTGVFETRWVSMPPIMSFDMIAKAAAHKLAFMPYCKWPQCKIG
jgi:hypothetical protein